MKVICAWCGKELGVKNGEKELISHGICKECMSNILLVTNRDSLSKYLDIFNEPVLVVNSSWEICAANIHAQNIIGKSSDLIDGLKGGDVFECEYAKLPGGCGNTVHCVACSIHKSILETHETGRGKLRVPAYLYQSAPNGKKKIYFLISTEKQDNYILLRIDKYTLEKAL